MPLEMTAGPPATVPGSGPPGPVGVADAGPPTGSGDPGVPFSALLAQQTPPVPAKPPTVVPAKTAEKSTTQDDDANPTDSQTTVGQSGTNQVIADWVALAAQQTLPPPVLQTTSLGLTKNLKPAGDTPAGNVPILSTEAMDTVSLSAPSAGAAKAENVSSGSVLASVTSPFSVASLTPPAAPQAAPMMGVVTPGPAAVETATPLSAAVSQTEATAPLVTIPAASPAASPGIAKDIDPRPALPMTAPLGNASSRAASTPVSAQGPAIASADTSLQTSAPVATGSVTVPVVATAVDVMPTVAAAVANSIPVQAAAVSAQSSVQATPSPAASAATNQSAAIQAATPVQITLQNLALPANNTSKSDGQRPVITPSISADAAPPVEEFGGVGVGQTGNAETATPRRLAAATAATQTGAAAPQGKSARGVGQTAPVDKTKAAPQDARKTEDDSLDSLDSAALPQTTAVLDASNSAAPIPDKPLTGAERAQVIQQAADGVRTVKPQVVTSGQGQMTLQLHPKEWGDLKVTVHLAAAQPLDGVKQTAVVAHIVASTPAVKSALETHSADLNQALRETGLRLDRLTVTVQPPDASGQSGSAGGDSSGSSPRNQDQSQYASSQNAAGNNPSSFGSFSERQGGRQFPTQTASGMAYDQGNEGEMGIYPVSNYTTKQIAGFDRRA